MAPVLATTMAAAAQDTAKRLADKLPRLRALVEQLDQLQQEVGATLPARRAAELTTQAAKHRAELAGLIAEADDALAETTAAAAAVAAAAEALKAARKATTEAKHEAAEVQREVAERQAKAKDTTAKVSARIDRRPSGPGHAELLELLSGAPAELARLRAEVDSGGVLSCGSRMTAAVWPAAINEFY